MIPDRFMFHSPVDATARATIAWLGRQIPANMTFVLPISGKKKEQPA
jgi:hypothetical protein